MKNMAQLCVMTLVAASAIFAATNPMVGGHEMFPTKNIIQNAMNSEDHTTLVAAVKAAGLVDTLEGPGPFTVFAPTNEAFAKLPSGTVDTLLMADNKPMLTKILTYHVVAGRLGSKEIARPSRRKRQSGTHHRERRQTLGQHAGQGPHPDRRKRRHRQGHHLQRFPIQRRHPRDRHRSYAKLKETISATEARRHRENKKKFFSFSLSVPLWPIFFVSARYGVF